MSVGAKTGSADDTAERRAGREIKQAFKEEKMAAAQATLRKKKPKTVLQLAKEIGFFILMVAAICLCILKFPTASFFIIMALFFFLGIVSNNVVV